MTFAAIRRFYFNVFLEAQRPARRTIDIYEGESAQVNFTILDRGGNRQDLTGATAEYRIARRVYGLGGVAEYAAGSGVSIADGVVSVDFTVTDALVAGEYEDQLRITKDGKTLIASTGRVNIRSDIE